MKAKLIKTEVNYILEDDKGVVIASTSLKKEGLSLSLKNCQAIERGYDLDELLDNITPKNGTIGNISERIGFVKGFQKAMELMGDKKFSEDDIILFGEYIRVASQSTPNVRTKDLFDEYQSLQKTEWDVEIVYDRDCYSSAGRCDKLTMADCIICTPVTYLKDADGCLILRRI